MCENNIPFAGSPPAASRILALVLKLGRRFPDRAGVFLPIPLLHEVCQLEVDEMYIELHKLAADGLVMIEGAYPFEVVSSRSTQVSLIESRSSS